MQSLLMAQCLPVAHLLQLGPPQSTSVSLPFRTASEQVGAWQIEAAHTPLTQSPLTPQPSPARQVAPQLPPQSMSLSFWSCVPSEHVAAQWPTWHRPPWQSALTEQILLKPHCGQDPPPQSVSVSLPFF